MQNAIRKEIHAQQSELRNLIRSELRAAFQEKMDQDFSHLKQQLASFEEIIKFTCGQYEELANTVKSYAEENKQLRGENILLKDKLKDVETRLSQLEQEGRQTNIEINCLPEHRSENLFKTVIQLGKVVSCPLSENYILSCTRVQKMKPTSNKPRAVICKLSNKIKRDNLLAAVYRYNKSNPKEKLNTKLLGYGDNGSPAKEKKYKFVWVRNGRIFVRKDVDTPAIGIAHIDNLNKIT
ncbi:unnamed protein product [Parnassius mnemosyne]|uniref:FP protein C-terminal domain-containing protein n=1 Tax=Parnassius mnemosyne TaxID=213953 RepID=A0AAV1KEW6_9NEOP